jgi:glutamate-1-semialdehyde 2,1-aminomutase
MDLPESRKLFDRARVVLPGGNSRSTIDLKPHPIYVTHGKDAVVYDVDGHEYVDFNNNYTSLILGHANDAVNDAVASQLPRGTAFSFGTEVEIEHAELLTSRVPTFDQIRFMNSGSEAVMNALKAARAFTGRSKIAKCEGAYHGSYDYAEVSLSAGPQDWGQNYPRAVPYAKGTPQGVLDDVLVIPYHDTLAARQLLEGTADDLAAVLFDPVASRVGMIPPTADYLDMLVEFCAAKGVLLIFDEVIAFRLGIEGAQGHYGVSPDLTALGKIIGGGFPVGAVAGRQQVMEVFNGGGLPHGGTFNANPITMVAGMETMRQMTSEAYTDLNALGEYTRERMRIGISNGHSVSKAKYRMVTGRAWIAHRCNGQVGRRRGRTALALAKRANTISACWQACRNSSRQVTRSCWVRAASALWGPFAARPRHTIWWAQPAPPPRWGLPPV